MRGARQMSKHGVRSAMLGLVMVFATSVPAWAVVEDVECNVFGFNCRGVWDHGTSTNYVWSNYTQLDLTHGSSVSGYTPDNVYKSYRSVCVSRGDKSYASLSGVNHSRKAYYRNC